MELQNRHPDSVSQVRPSRQSFALVTARVRYANPLQWLPFLPPLSDTMCDELCGEDIGSLPLPKDWTDTVRHAVLNVVCIVRIAMLAGREFLIREGDVADAHVRISRPSTSIARTT